ncbi:MAG: type II secretion system protein [Candidatus Vogelbacteria bacterium]|nr:type II secretion system protein [Candidatus Vogelbacteria bacterium]
MMEKGFTLVEIIIVVGILLTLATITITALSKFSQFTALSKDTEKIVSLLNRARSDTISSKNDVRYGVHFESTKAVLFAGDSYVSNTMTNEVVTVLPTATIRSVTLNGGGSNVLFDRLTGATSESGNIIISLLGSGANSRQITISSNGVAQ